jgi:hypothetical protein
MRYFVRRVAQAFQGSLYARTKRGRRTLGRRWLRATNAAASAKRPARRNWRLAGISGLTLLALAGSLPAGAVAAPTVSVVGRAVPIPDFPHTGNFYGAGAAVHAHITVSGTEYGGFPDPLIGIRVLLPKGVKLNPSAFPTCPIATLEPSGQGPSHCPKGSEAGPPGTAEGYVAFGTSIVPETVRISSFYAPHGGFVFFAYGHEPVLLEILAHGQLVTDNAGNGFGPEFEGEIPLVETVPGAQDASVKTIDITLGSAIRKHGRPVYYGTVPRTCPKGGFKAKAEFKFAVNGSVGDTETVTVPVTAPCPPGRG